MYRTIIVPLDGSTRSETAVPLAARLAEAAQASLVLARVHGPAHGDVAGDPDFETGIRDAEAWYLEAIARNYESTTDRPVVTALLDGEVTTALVEFIASNHAPLVVMTGHRRTGISRALLGSTADGLVRHGRAPVLLLREPHNENEAQGWYAPPIRTVLVALDGTPTAERSMTHAVAVAKLSLARIHLVRVVEPELTVEPTHGFPGLPAPIDQRADSAYAIADDYLLSVAERTALGCCPLKITTEVLLSKDPAAALVACCTRHNVDVVAIASHGRGASRLLQRAVTDGLLRDGPNAVLITRPGRATTQTTFPTATPSARRRRKFGPAFRDR